MFLDKYNSSSNAFFFSLAQGVKKFVQSEGGSCQGATEMSFLYELGINGFVQNIPDILHDPPDPQGKPGVVAGYIDDLYWAATFDEMVDVIRFVVERGPALWL